LTPLLRLDAGTPELDVRQLEALGSCPFRHYAQWLLGLEPREDGRSGPSLPRFYRQLVSRTIQLLRDTNYDWNMRREEPLRVAAQQAFSDLAEKFALNGEGTAHILQRAGLLLERVMHELRELPAGRAPFWLNVRFGSGERFAPVVVNSPLGQLHVRGRVDRVDVENGAATLVDLRLSAGDDALDWPRFAAGSSLALPAALLALRGHTHWDASTQTTVELKPVSAEVQRVEPQWADDVANFAPASLRRRFAREDANAKLEALIDNTLLETERILETLVRRLLSGEIAARPLRCGRWTACVGCSLRPVCRFDPAVGDVYREQASSSAELRDRIAAGQPAPVNGAAP
jgi:ATP-dependent helicase/DNAse subunit B